MYGKLAVDIHRTTCLLESGDSFFVPPGALLVVCHLKLLVPGWCILIKNFKLRKFMH